MSMPCIMPSPSTMVKRNSLQKGSSAAAASTAVSGRRGPPAVDGYAAAAGVHGGDDAVGANGIDECRRERLVHGPFLEEGRSDDDVRRTGFEHGTRAVERADAAADAARPPLARVTHERVVVWPVPIAASRSISWSFVEPGERVDPLVEIGILEGEPLTLNELDDTVVSEVDRRDEHC